MIKNYMTNKNIYNNKFNYIITTIISLMLLFKEIICVGVYFSNNNY